LNNKLDHTHALYKKGQSRPSAEETEVLWTFFDSAVGSAIFDGVVCWSSSISTADRK